jgi:hypothetical protein
VTLAAVRQIIVSNNMIPDIDLPIVEAIDRINAFKRNKHYEILKYSGPRKRKHQHVDIIARGINLPKAELDAWIAAGYDVSTKAVCVNEDDRIKCSILWRQIMDDTKRITLEAAGLTASPLADLYYGYVKGLRPSAAVPQITDLWQKTVIYASLYNLDDPSKVAELHQVLKEKLDSLRK